MASFSSPFAALMLAAAAVFPSSQLSAQASIPSTVRGWGISRFDSAVTQEAIVDVKAEPATVSELDRQLNLNESVLRTKVMRTDKH